MVKSLLKFRNGEKIFIGDFDIVIPDSRDYNLIRYGNYNGYRLKLPVAGFSPIPITSLIYPNSRNKPVKYLNGDYSDLRATNLVIGPSRPSNKYFIAYFGKDHYRIYSKNSDILSALYRRYRDLLLSREKYTPDEIIDSISSLYREIVDVNDIPNIKRFDGINVGTYWVFSYRHKGTYYTYKSHHPTDVMLTGDLIKLAVNLKINPVKMAFPKNNYSQEDIIKVKEKLHMYVTKGYYDGGTRKNLFAINKSFPIKKADSPNYGLTLNNVGRGSNNSIICQITIPRKYISNGLLKKTSGKILFTCKYQDSFDSNKYTSDIAKRILYKDYGVHYRSLMFPELDLKDFPKSLVEYVKGKVDPYMNKVISRE